MAVTLTSAELASAAGVSSEQAERLLPVAKALVERYTPTAPVAILNEAANRLTLFGVCRFSTCRSTIRRRW